MEDDLGFLIDVFPEHIQMSLAKHGSYGGLLEVIMDVGRLPEARFLTYEIPLSDVSITEADIGHVVERIGGFGADNRAGIEATLHRISAIRNRSGKIIGLTCRVGRAVYGTVKLIEDLIQSGNSVLLLGRPGVGKTTMLREVARVLADYGRKRVVIVDTSNEVAGDGDIPHPAIGHSRRMQVVSPNLQHSVMIEAVENHMPEVIIIDEMGTEQEAAAARTIAERGVQLIATAHGNTLDNLMQNPVLSDLIGGIQTVTLGDDEARRRRSQKSILERKSPPTFNVVVEIQNWNRVAIHDDVSRVVDAMLRGIYVKPDVRSVGVRGEVERLERNDDVIPKLPAPIGPKHVLSTEVIRLLPFGVNKGTLNRVIQGDGIPVGVVDDVNGAEVIMTTKQFFRKMPKLLKSAEESGKTILVLKKNSFPQIRSLLWSLCREMGWEDPVEIAEKEVQEAVKQVQSGLDNVSLTPQSAYVRRRQHQFARELSVVSVSTGREPNRRVTISRR